MARKGRYLQWNSGYLITEDENFIDINLYSIGNISLNLPPVTKVWSINFPGSWPAGFEDVDTFAPILTT